MTARTRVRRRVDHPADEPEAAQIDSAAPEHVAEVIDPVGEAEACVMGHNPRAERFMGLLCKRHYHLISRRLTEIVELYATLPDAKAVSAMHVPAIKTAYWSPAPVQLDAIALTDRRAGRVYRATEQADSDDTEEIFDVHAVLGSWVAIVCRELQVPPVPLPATVLAYGPVCSRSPACWHLSCAAIRGERTEAVNVTLSSLTTFLSKYKHWIAAQPWVPDFMAALELVHRSLAQASGASMWPDTIGKCPNCGWALYSTIGVDQVECRNRKCKSVWSGIRLARILFLNQMEEK